MNLSHSLAAGLLLLGLAVLAPAQNDPEKKTAAPQAEAKKTGAADALPLPEDIIRKIDRLKVQQLKVMLREARNSLSDKGQKLLRAKYVLIRVKEQADEIATALKEDPAIAQVQTIFRSPEAQKDLAGLSKLNPQDKRKAFAEFLKKSNVTDDALVKFLNYKEAEIVQEKVPPVLARLEQRLKAASADELPEPVLSGAPGLLGRLAAIEAMMASSEEPAGAGTNTGGATADPDLLDRLVQILK